MNCLKYVDVLLNADPIAFFTFESGLRVYYALLGFGLGIHSVQTRRVFRWSNMDAAKACCLHKCFEGYKYCFLASL